MIFKKLTEQLLLFVLIIILLSGCKVYTAFNDIVDMRKEQLVSEKTGVPRLDYINSVPVLHLYGSPYEMGKQYGELLHNQLNSFELLLKKFFPDRKFKKYMELGAEMEPHLPADAKAFIQGMVDASGIDYMMMVTLNIVPRTTCSVLAVWGDATENGKLLMGRNADYRLKRINRALGLMVVKHPEKGNATLSASFLGLVGSLTGINEHGVAFGNMLVYNGKSDEVDKSGMPVHLLMQMGAEQSNTARELNDFLIDQKHMIPINVMCADSNEALLAELSQNNYCVRNGNEGVLAATNNFNSPGMFRDAINCKRFASLMTMSKEFYGKYNIDILQKSMHKARQVNKNLQCVLFEPEDMKMHVSMNRVPATKGPFLIFDVKKILSE